MIFEKNRMVPKGLSRRFSAEICSKRKFLSWYLILKCFAETFFLGNESDFGKLKTLIWTEISKSWINSLTMNVQTVILIISRSISRFVGNFSFISKAMNEKDMNNIYQNVILSLLRPYVSILALLIFPFFLKMTVWWQARYYQIRTRKRFLSMALLVSMGSLRFRIWSSSIISNHCFDFLLFRVA